MRDGAHEGLPAGLPAASPLGAGADPGFDRFAALVREMLGVPVALVSMVDVHGQAFPGASGLPLPWSETRCTPLSHSFCQYVVANREPLVVRDAREDALLAGNLAIDDIGVIAYAGVPLEDVERRVVGSLCAIDTRPRDWTSREIALLTDLAAACSAELQLRSTARLARRAEQRAAALLDLSETLTGTATIEDVSRAVHFLARNRLGAEFGGVSVVDPARGVLRYVDLSSLPADIAADYELIPLTVRTPSAVVARTGRAELFADLNAMHDRFPATASALGGAGIGAAAVLPLSVGDRLIGTMSMLWPEAHPFDVDDRALLGALSRYTAQAVQRAMLLADRREVAHTLQRAMLPELPTLPWLELATRYLPARQADAVGGDWYDVFALPGDDLCVSVGDVEGHDTRAAAAMGQLRAMIRALALSADRSPSATMAALDDALALARPARYATAVLATLSPPLPDGSAGFRWTNAGHQAPLLLRPGRAAQQLTRPAALPVGLGFRPERTTHSIVLPPGSTVLVHTDGLVERRDRDPDESYALLRAAAQRYRELPLPQMLSALTDDLAGDDHEDDVLLLGLRLPPR